LNDSERLVNNVLASLTAGRKETARRLLSGAVAKDPANQEAWLYLAVALPPDKAAEALRRVLEINPGHKLAQSALTKLETDPAKPLELCDIVLTEIPAQPAAPQASTRKKSATPRKRPAPKPQISETVELAAESEIIIAPEVPLEAAVEAVPEVITPVAPLDDTPAAQPLAPILPTQPAPREVQPYVRIMARPMIEHLKRNEASPADSSNIPPTNSENHFINGGVSPYLRTPAKLKARPVRRTRRTRGSSVSLTSFGIILTVAVLVIIIGYFLFIHI